MIKITLFMLVNQRNEFYCNYEKRGYSKVSCWVKDQRKASIWFAKNGPVAAMKHVKLTKDKITQLSIISKEVELPTIDDVLFKVDF